MVDFGKRLKALRKDAGLTQEELAKKLLITKSVVSYYENQERFPSPDILLKLAEIFNVSVDFLLGRTKTYKTLDISDLTDEQIHAVQKIVELFKNR